MDQTQDGDGVASQLFLDAEKMAELGTKLAQFPNGSDEQNAAALNAQQIPDTYPRNEDGDHKRCLLLKIYWDAYDLEITRMCALEAIEFALEAIEFYDT